MTLSDLDMHVVFLLSACWLSKAMMGVWSITPRKHQCSFSIYDIYLLTPALGKIADVKSNANLGIVLEFLRVTGEYGGTMNYT